MIKESFFLECLWGAQREIIFCDFVCFVFSKFCFGKGIFQIPTSWAQWQGLYSWKSPEMFVAFMWLRQGAPSSGNKYYQKEVIISHILHKDYKTSCLNSWTHREYHPNLQPSLTLQSFMFSAYSATLLIWFTLFAVTALFSASADSFVYQKSSRSPLISTKAQ